MSNSIWSDLMSSALVGTDRRRLVLPGTDGPLAGVLSALGTELDPDGLLSAAGAVTVARRAGQAAARPQRPEPAAAETDPYAPVAAQQRLAALLSGGDAEIDRTTARELAAEWLRVAAKRGLLAGPAILVALLDLGSSDSSVRASVRAVGGTRLGWLALQGPGRWAWAVQQEETAQPSDWDTGRAADRVRYLGELRARDAAAGRDLLLEAWPQEKASDLAALIAACGAGLGPDDEPWLEKALDDRRAQVREAAARLLGVLPGSAYRQRMADRALACVHVADRRLVATAPTECDDAMRRDGISVKPPPSVGERTHWLRQIIEYAPLDCWTAYDQTPAGLLSRKFDDTWGPVLRAGLTRAAITQRHGAWAAVLILDGIGRRDMNELRELAAVMPEPDLAELIAAQLRRKVDAVVRFLDVLPQPWAAPVADAVLECLADAERRRSGWWQLLRHAEWGFDPAYAPRVRALHDSLPIPDQQLLARFTTMLQIRHDIHQELT
ncbi:DUF5691 domain-containing protein [Catellatospora citrea]|uniref:Uncharacterized protein n=1 Tax=Catellatospora citrea TaxID=53366 RepID=A0A8J3KKZ2_9ACTN|nr:DUF5691 domain-containing protein [Catellatospora citrea]RKE10431.1 hypothetical protein C8E86_5331 [Catellatospora citrea]GIF99063.1 hypothetical protein Cci01nite_41570 [Catellatospora citrea]